MHSSRAPYDLVMEDGKTVHRAKESSETKREDCNTASRAMLCSGGSRHVRIPDKQC